MAATIILTLYVILFALQHVWELFLSLLNRRFVRQKRNDPPPFVDRIMDSDTYGKSVDYTLTRSKFGIISGTVSSLFVLTLVLSGSLGWLDTLISRLNVGLYTRGVFFFFAVSLIVSLFSLPFSLYSRFVIEQRFGFNRMTPGLFILDMLKGALISLALMTPLLYGLFWFMDSTGRFWWVYAFAGFSLFQLVVLILYPTVIAPLFNKFTSLPEGSLRDRIIALAERLGFRTRGIFVMDGSKRSGHSNAYFMGLGRAKRIVLFDTLVEAIEEDQIAAVLAHEIGHEKKNHVKKRLAINIVFSLAGFYVLSLLLPYTPFFQAFGFEAPSYHAAVVLLSFCAGPFTFYLQPLMALWSRKHEYEADRFSVHAMDTAEPLRSALINLSRENLSNLTPHPWYSFYHYSHPTLEERIEAMEASSVKNGEK